MLLALFLGSISLSAYLHLGALGKTALEKNRGRLLNPIQVVNFPHFHLYLYLYLYLYLLYNVEPDPGGELPPGRLRGQRGGTRHHGGLSLGVRVQC